MLSRPWGFLKFIFRHWKLSFLAIFVLLIVKYMLAVNSGQAGY